MKMKIVPIIIGTLGTILNMVTKNNIRIENRKKNYNIFSNNNEKVRDISLVA